MQAYRTCTRLATPVVQKRAFFSLPNVVPSFLDSKRVYSERKLLNYSQAQVYDIVSNVTDYHQFIPFCTHSKVFTSRPVKAGNGNQVVMEAELGVGFNLFNEKYTSMVTCDNPSQVKAESADATLFKELTTVWRFTPNVDRQKLKDSQTPHHPSCWVDFSIAFEFASPLHAQASGVFFDKVSSMMMTAFIDRCAQVYGKR